MRLMWFCVFLLINFFFFVEDKEKGVCVVVVGEAPEIVCVGIQRRKENECVPTGS